MAPLIDRIGRLDPSNRDLIEPMIEPLSRFKDTLAILEILAADLDDLSLVALFYPPRSPGLVLMGGMGFGKSELIARRAIFLSVLSIWFTKMLFIARSSREAIEFKTRIAKKLSEFPRLSRENDEWILGLKHELSEMKVLSYRALGTELLKEYSRAPRRNGRDRSRPAVPRPARESERDKLIREVVDELHLEITFFSASAYVARRKHSSTIPPPPLNADPSDCEDLFNRYERKLLEQGLMDGDDPIRAAADAVRGDEGPAAAWGSRYSVIFCDRHEDASPVEDLLLRSISSSGPSLTIAGDPSAAIFEWRGGSSENLRTISTRLRGISCITLKARKRPESEVIEIAVFENEEAETSGVARLAMDFREELSLAGTAAVSSLAIVARSRERLNGIARHLHALGVGFCGHRAERMPPEWDDLLILAASLAFDLRATSSRETTPWESATAESLHRDAVKIVARLLRLKEPHTREATAIFSDSKRPTSGTGGARKREPIAERIAVLREFFGVAAVNTPDSLLEGLATRAGIRNAGTLLPFITELSKSWRGADPEIFKRIADDALDALPDSGISGGGDSPLVLGTIHSVKGREFSRIVVLGLEEETFPSKASLENFDLAGDERLFRIAISRATKSTLLTRTSRSPDGKKRAPSRFLKLIPRDRMREFDQE